MTAIYWLGAHKTATTFLQKSLDLSQEVLAEHGIHYMELNEFRRKYTRPLLEAEPDDAPAANEFVGDRDTTLVFDENIPGYVQHALSADGFYPDAVAHTRTIAAHLDAPVERIVFGVRNYETYLPSLYCETLKSTKFKTFDAYLRTAFRDSTDFERMNWHVLLSELVEAWPGIPVQVYFHEDLRGNEATLLSKVLGIPAAEFELVEKAERVGFSGDAVAALHQINDAREVVRKDVGAAVRKFPTGPDHPTFNPWNDHDRELLRAAYQRDKMAIVADDTIEVIHLPAVRRSVEQPSAGHTESAATDGDVDVSIIIPVHNAATTLAQVVGDFLATPVPSVEVILVDDASTDGSSELVDDLTADARVKVVHHATNRGAGVARNTGFGHATGRYTLFFDADDIVHAEALAGAVSALDATIADVAMMPYHYMRGHQATHADMNVYDVETWQHYLGTAPMRLGTLDQMPGLLGFSNYPWNKVVRTARYRDTDLRFGSTPVHNDILGHWHTLLFARKILLINAEVCTHIVDATGANLTNQHSATRLALFDALDETYDLLMDNPELRNRYSHHYWSAVLRVSSWAGDRIAPEHRAEFKLLLQNHLFRANLADFARMRMKRDPVLANAMIQKALA